MRVADGSTLEELCYIRPWRGWQLSQSLCNILPMWFIQKPKARARGSGLIAVCPESLAGQAGWDAFFVVVRAFAVSRHIESRVRVEEYDDLGLNYGGILRGEQTVQLLQQPSGQVKHWA